MKRKVPNGALLVAAALLVGCTSMTQQTLPKRTLGGPLTLADQGSFFVGGRTVTTDGFQNSSPQPDFLKAGEVTVDQMYVQYMIPAQITGAPVVMMHGFNHTGVTFETTPDGREGWATYFARKGHPVYVVDQPGRGRSGFDPTSFNKAKTTGNPSGQPAIPYYPLKYAWGVFRFGKEYPAVHQGMKFPVEAVEAYTRQLVPNLENTLKPDIASIDLAELLNTVGPAVVLVHSQAGGMGMGAVKLRPEKTLALINVEGNCVPMTEDEAGAVFTKFPYLALWGDYSVGTTGPVGDVRRNGCANTVNLIKQKRGRADFVFLADHGMPGHSHMMMMDKGNLLVADYIMAWLTKNGIGAQR
jgi:pimeloyl-ACP methyl ester carboxylesterase